MAFKRPKAILFDMGGVLTDSVDDFDDVNFPLSFPEGLPDGVTREWFMGVSRACLRNYFDGVVPRKSVDSRPVIAKWLSQRGTEPSAEAVDHWHSVLARWETRPVYPHVRPALAELHDMGLRLGVVSNVLFPGNHHRDNYRKHGILDYFEITVYSADCPFAKPHPSIFRHALDLMRLPGSEVWYIGDKPHRDIGGAHSVGMTAVLVDSPHHAHIHDAPENEPDLKIRNIADLPRAVRDAMNEG